MTFIALSPVAPRPREGLTKPITVAQPRPQERAPMPEAVERRVCRGRRADLNSSGCGRGCTLIQALRPGLLAAFVQHR